MNWWLRCRRRLTTGKLGSYINHSICQELELVPALTTIYVPACVVEPKAIVIATNAGARSSPRMPSLAVARAVRWQLHNHLAFRNHGINFVWRRTGGFHSLYLTPTPRTIFVTSRP